MIISTMNKAAVVPYVEDLLQDFELGLQSITITRAVKSEDSSALTVIGLSSDDIEESLVLKNFSYQLQGILDETTPGGLYHPE